MEIIESLLKVALFSWVFVSISIPIFIGIVIEYHRLCNHFFRSQ
jgi:hypothetical protein